MRNIMTFEAYQTYSDYKNYPKTDSSPESLLNDVTVSVKHLLPTFEDKWIKSIEEQSDDKKGIKFQINLTNGDTIHAFKIGRFWGQWEWYLNKKKKNSNDIKKYLSEALMSPLELWQLNFAGFDRYYMYADDSRAYNSGSAHEKSIVDMYNKLSSADKKKAYKIYTEYNGKNNTPSVSFPEFKGV